MTPLFPTTRLRRLRQSEALRSLVRETAVTANDLIQPIFIEEGIDDPLPIAEMPGVSRIPERKIEHVVEGLARDGVKALMLFGISHHKDASAATPGTATAWWRGWCAAPSGLRRTWW